MTMFLVNPPRRRRVVRKHKKRSKARGMFRHNPALGYSRAYADRFDSMFGSSTRKRRKARSSKMAKRKSRRRRPTARRRKYTRIRARKGVFRVKGRGKRRRVRRVRVRSKAGRLMRRNPPRMSLSNIKSMVIEGSKDAVGVIVGQVGTRLINNLIPFSGGMAVNTAKGVASALASSYLVSMVSPRMGRMALAGGLSEVVRPLLAQVPGVGGFISGEDFLGIGAYTLGAYTEPRGISAYEAGDGPQMSGMDFLGAGDESGY